MIIDNTNTTTTATMRSSRRLAAGVEPAGGAGGWSGVYRAGVVGSGGDGWAVGLGPASTK